MAKKTNPAGNPNIIKLWPTILLAKRFAHYQKVNPALLELFYEHRDREHRSPQQAYASRDDLLSQYPLHDELNELAESEMKKYALILLGSGFRFQIIIPSTKCMYTAIAPGPGFTTCVPAIAAPDRNRIAASNRTE